MRIDTLHRQAHSNGLLELQARITALQAANLPLVVPGEGEESNPYIVDEDTWTSHFPEIIGDLQASWRMGFLGIDWEETRLELFI